MFFDSLLGGVGQLVLPPPVIALLDPRVVPQTLDGVHKRVLEFADLLHVHVSHDVAVALQQVGR